MCCLESYVVKVCCLGGAAAKRNKKHKILVTGVLKHFLYDLGHLVDEFEKDANKNSDFRRGSVLGMKV